MRQIIDYLEQLDLSEIEVKLYVSLLKTGPISVRELAELTEVKRTTTYIYIDQLAEKGLIVKLVKGSRKLIAANQPEEALKYLVKRKSESLRSIKAGFPGIISRINTVYPQIKDVGEAEFKFYKGKSGVKKIYEEALRAKELRSYVNITDVLKAFPGNAKLFDNAIKQNPEMKMFEIVEDSPQARNRIKTSDKRGRYFYKFLPKDMTIASNDVLIYDGKISIINLKDKINGVILHNIDLYNSFRQLFDFLWNILPE